VQDLGIVDGDPVLRFAVHSMTAPHPLRGLEFLIPDAAIRRYDKLEKISNAIAIG